MALNYEEIFSDRSDYGRGRGPDYLTPAGTPRRLSTSERARLLRAEGINDPGRPGQNVGGAYDPAQNPDPGSVQLAPGFRS